MGDVIKLCGRFRPHPLNPVTKILPQPEGMSMAMAFSVAQKDMPVLCILLEVDHVTDPHPHHCEVLGRELVKYQGYRFRLGKRLLEHAASAYDGRLWPDPSFCMSKQRQPSEADLDRLWVVEDWYVDLEQRDDRPPLWRLYGFIVDLDGSDEPIDGDRLLAVTPDKKWALGEHVGWVRLGRFWGGYCLANAT
jgi:hypothetical protein